MFTNVTSPMAKKPHICCLCNGEIKIGEKYINVVGSDWVRSFYEDKFHIHCYNLREVYCQNLENGDEFNNRDVIDDIVENVCHSCDNYHDCDMKFKTIVQCSEVKSRYLPSCRHKAYKEVLM